MAEGFVVPDSMDYIYDCSVCFEKFTPEGKNVPRILPCSHTLCEKCIEDILDKTMTEDQGFLPCPQCQRKHQVDPEDGVKTFPQNHFILPILRRKPDICEEHKRDITFFCNNQECQMTVCNVCLRNNHRGHNFEDLKQLREAKYKLFQENVEKMKENFEYNRLKILAKKKNLNDNLEKCIKDIKIEKELKIKLVTKLLTNKYDDLMKTVKEHKEGENKKIAADTEAIVETLKEVDTTETELNPRTFSLEDINQRLETLRDIDAEIQKDLAGVRTFKQFEYKGNETLDEDIEKLTGELKGTLDELGIFETTVMAPEPVNQRDSIATEIQYSGRVF